MLSPWWAVGSGLATTAAVELIKLPISCLFFYAWWLHRLYNIMLNLVVDWSWLMSNRVCPPPNHHRGGGRTTVQPPQPHLWCRAVMAQPLVKHRGGQPPKTTTVVAAEPTLTTTAAPWWWRGCG
nr:hypothetical protein [Tanacetum cinerariifolium]